MIHAFRRVGTDVPRTAEGWVPLENWLVCQIAIREARATVPGPGGKPWPPLPDSRPTTVPAISPTSSPTSK